MRERPLPRGPLSPPERHADRAAAAARSAARTSRSWRGLYLEQAAHGARRRAEDAEPRSGRGAAEVRLARQRARARERLPAAHGHGRGSRDRGRRICRTSSAAVATSGGRGLDDGLAQWAEGQLAVTAAPPLLDEALPAFERTLIVDRAAPRARQAARGRQVARLGPQHAHAQDQGARPRGPGLTRRPSAGSALSISATICSASSSAANPSAPDTSQGLSSRIASTNERVSASSASPFLEVPALGLQSRAYLRSGSRARDAAHLAAAEIDRDVLIRLEHADHPLRARRRARRRDVRDRAVRELDARVRDVDVVRQHRDADGRDTHGSRRRRATGSRRGRGSSDRGSR